MTAELVGANRGDGWPLCPSCGEDEVWSPLIIEDDQGYPRTPTLEEYMEFGVFACLACGWKREPEVAP